MSLARPERGAGPTQSVFAERRPTRSPRHGQVIFPSTVDAAPAATCTLQLVIVLEIDALLAATVYPFVAEVIVIVLPVDSE